MLNVTIYLIIAFSIERATRASSPSPYKMQTAPKPASKVDATLIALRARSLELHARLSELRDSAAMVRDGVGPSRNSTWPDFLTQHDTLSRLSTQLTEDLQRSLADGLDNFVAVPKAVTPDPNELPDLLRTRLDPAVEREYEALGKEFDGEDVSRRISAFNGFLEREVETFQDLRESLSKARPQEKSPRAPSAAADAVLAAIATGTGLRQQS